MKPLSIDLEDPHGRFILDIDIGGTFSDAIISQENLIKFLKVDTTPHDLSHCVQQVLERASKELHLPNISSFLSKTEVLLGRRVRAVPVGRPKGWRKRN